MSADRTPAPGGTRTSHLHSEHTLATRDAAMLAADLSMSGHALQAGTRLQDYVISGLLGEGGFGIVYLAQEEALQREVAIKEYLPSSMASRAKDAQTVLVKSKSHEETFAAGLKSFINEARLLARFDHPALVKVHRFWEAHGTAYMVMPYYRGPTLKATLAELDHLPTLDELGSWLWPLMDALAVMHAAHCYHRDIAPDNILITEAGPLLLDFGAARRVVADMTHALTVVLKPGFAPIEQYGDLPGMTQGPWTDIYALASVLYAATTGKRPMPSVERLLDDRLRPASELAEGRYPAPFLQAIDAALALRPADRPQSVQAFRALLERGLDGAANVPGHAAPARAPAVAVPRTLQPTQALTQGLSLDATQQPAHAVRPAHTTAAPAASSTLKPLALGGALGLLLLAAGGWFVLGRGDSGAGGQTASSAMPAAAPASTPAPVATAPVVAEPVIHTSATTAPVALPSPAPEPAAQPPSASAAAVPAQPEPDVASKPPPVASKPRIHEPAREAVKPPVSSAKAEHSPDVRAKCSDILQKASLEPLSASEQAYLRKECR